MESDAALWGSVLSADEMRAVEQRAIASGQTTGWDMMRRAGNAAAAAIFETWPSLSRRPRAALVMCGPGNNGGDGFVLAANLLRRGWRCDLFLFGDPEALQGDAATACASFGAEGGVVLAWEASRLATALQRDDDPPAVVVEALFGTGLDRDCDAVLEPWDGALHGLEDGGSVRLVTLDMPAGLSADSGQRFGARAFEADLCVTFHRCKTGHLFGEAPRLIERLRVVSIGLTQDDGRIGPGMPLMRPDRLWDVSKGGGHKYDEGHALVVAGPSAAGGAARLAARGALRVGAGLVTVGAASDALAEHAAQLNAVMLRELGDGGSLSRRLRDDPRINALCLGPGLGVDLRGVGLVEAALAADRAVVLDADALTILSQRKALMPRLHRACVLTPHRGEFARLFPEIARRLDEDMRATPLEAAREAARSAGCIMLLKGPATVVCDPDGRAAINAAVFDDAAPWLATAGSGDVLSGIVAGLLARGAPPLAAAATAAWLHAEAARLHGPGLVAEDLPDMLPQVFRKLHDGWRN